jgi:hypothetical protein
LIAEKVGTILLQIFQTNKYLKYNEWVTNSTHKRDSTGFKPERRSCRMQFRGRNESTTTRFGEMMSKRLILFSFFLLTSSFVYSKTLQSVAIAPQGAVIVAGTSIPYTVVCTYSDASTDGCAAAGGATWTTPTKALTVSSSGVATWSASYNPENSTAFPNGSQTALGMVIVTASGMQDSGTLLAQSPSDVFGMFPTPASNLYTDNQTGAALPIDVVLGSTVTMGIGFNINGGQSGNPFQMTCNWTSSDNSIATVSRYGMATAISPGSVTITCGQAGNGAYGTGSAAGRGNTFAFKVVAPAVTGQTWYVRPDGGTPYVNSTQTPAGQCSGLVNAPYPGTGVNQPCAMGNLRYLWTDQVTPNHEQWMIGPGDTVIVAQNSAGYNVGKDARGLDEGGTTSLPINCGNTAQCYMPTIPSGTAAQHTRILGANYASCHSDSAKTRLNVSWAAQNGFNVDDSQFVDVACFEITQQSQCGGSGFYTHACTKADNYGQAGIRQSALTASVTYTDIFIHGLAIQGVIGATGGGVVADYLHIRGVPLAGINMDDGPWNFTNISVAGGFTMNNSITEFVGCVEENPVVHNYPYIECRDSETGGYGDGFGTASTTGTWSFDHDIWRYNFQDGLDLLHSGLQSLTVTNSQSYGNDGNAYKIGSATNVLFQNNVALENCNRIGYLFGDEPASAIVPGVNFCRADGGWLAMQFSPLGTYVLQDNTLVGYGDVAVNYGCSAGGDNCSTANTTLQNNLFLAYADTLYNGGEEPAILCANVNGNCNQNPTSFPANQGWAIRSNNLYYNTRSCPLSLTAAESCNTRNPLLANAPASPISAESVLDNFNFLPSSSSPLIGAGVAIPNLLTDNAGVLRPNPPSIGALEYAAGTALSSSQLALTATPNPVAVGQSVTLTASVAEVGSVSPTGTVTFFVNGNSLNSVPLTNGVATLSVSTLTAGANSITATYTGDSTYAAGSSSVLTLTVNAPSTATTKTALQVSSPTVTAGQPITLTAAVTTASGTPTGTVSFLSSGAVLGSATVSSSGVATLPISSLAAGSYTLTAQYAGTSTLAASTSPAVTETVNQVSAAATKTALQVSSNPITKSEAVTLTAIVTTASGVPTGTISFLDNGVVLGSAPVGPSGVAEWQISSMPAGSYTLMAQYTGTSTFSASTSAAVTGIAKPGKATSTTTALVVSPNPITAGQPITLTATVIAASGTPTGTVSFLSNGAVLGSATVSSSGVATLPISSMSAGSYTLTAQYAGTSTFDASSSSVISETVNAAPAAPGVNLALSTPTLMISSSTPTSNSVALTLTPVGGYTGTLQMACVTPPAGTSCSFQPQTVTVGSTPIQVGITVQTAGTTTAALRSQEPSTPGNAPAVPASILWIPGLLAAALIGKERKRLPRSGTLLILLLLAGAFGTLTGCGSGITAILPGAQTVALKVMVTGTGNLTQSITLNVTTQ